MESDSNVKLPEFMPSKEMPFPLSNRVNCSMLASTITGNTIGSNPFDENVVIQLDMGCGVGFTESVTLSGVLFCDGDVTPILITMQGADAILDCNGYKIFGSNVDRVGLAVQLTDGASAINCPIGNVIRGISIDGNGCSMVMNVAIAFTLDDSIAVTNSATTVLDSIVIESSNEDRIDVEGGGGTGLVIMSDITVCGADNNGICLSAGAATVELYGDIFIEKTGQEGFAIDGGGVAVTAYCSLTVFDSDQDGISFDFTSSGTFTFESGSTTTSCFTLRALALVVLSGSMGRMSSVTLLTMLDLSTAMKTVSSYQDCRGLELPG